MGRRSTRGARRPRRRRQGGRLDLARRGRQVPRPAGDPQGRPLRHPRPRRHRGPAGRGGADDAPPAVPDRAAQDVRHRDRPRRGDHHPRRRRRGHRPPRHDRGHRRGGAAAAVALTGRPPPGAAHGLGGEDRRPAPARAGPRRRSRSSARPDPSPCTASTSTPCRASPACAGPRSCARRAPTSGCWAPTWAPPSVVGPTCGRCDARPSARSTSTPSRARRAGPARAAAAPGRGLRDYPAVTVDEAVAADVRPTARCCPVGHRTAAGRRRRAAGVWRVLDRTAPCWPSTSPTAPARPSRSSCSSGPTDHLPAP